MIRNRVISNNGSIKYLSISAETKGFLDRQYRDIKVKNVEQWRTKHLALLENYYRKALYVDEMMSILTEYYRNDYLKLNEWTCESIRLVMEILDIKTPILYQSEIDYNRDNKKSDLVMSLCEAIGANTYYSGKGGSVVYLDPSEFSKHDIDIEYQSFVHPIYDQCNSPTFIAGVSILDLLFNCGIKKGKSIFWNSVNESLEHSNNNNLG